MALITFSVLGREGRREEEVESRVDLSLSFLVRAFVFVRRSDRRASISSKWAHSLADEDVTVGLPTTLDQFKRGPGVSFEDEASNASRSRAKPFFR